MDGDLPHEQRALTRRNLVDAVSSAPVADQTARQEIQDRIDDILRPAGAFARLDAAATHLAEWQRTATPRVQRPAALIFAADHGVVADGVSAYPADVTAAMLAAFEASKATVSALAAVAGATVTAIDVGVGRPTANLRVEAALSPQRFADAFTAGRDAVSALDADLLILGEMGIGNTTAAASVTAAILGGEVADYVGTGTGVDDDTHAHKVDVVTEAVERISGVDDALEVLRQVGGAELVAIAGALTEARLRSLPVLLDGYIATAPALALHAIDPRLTAHVLAGHCSAEPGHRLQLERLERKPLLTLDLRLGEGSGAVAAIPLLQMACAAVNDVATFTEWFGGAEAE